MISANKEKVLKLDWMLLEHLKKKKKDKKPFLQKKIFDWQALQRPWHPQLQFLQSLGTPEFDRHYPTPHILTNITPFIMPNVCLVVF